MAFTSVVVNKYGPGDTMGEHVDRNATGYIMRLLVSFQWQQDPDFTYTIVMLNNGFASHLHVDQDDPEGMSYTISLGDFEGGELLVQADDGESEIVVKHPIRGAPGLRPGSKIRGKIVSSRITWVRFDALRPHKVMPITGGTRISLNYFTRLGWQEMPSAVRARLWPRRQHGRTC